MGVAAIIALADLQVLASNAEKQGGGLYVAGDKAEGGGGLRATASRELSGCKLSEYEYVPGAMR